MTSKWPGIGAVAPTELVEARLEVHHAAQLAAALGASLLERRSDDSQSNLGWSHARGGFLGHTVPGKPDFAAVLRPADLTLALADASGGVLAELGLTGLDLERGRAWLDERVRALGADGAIRLPGYELPKHPVQDGAPFADGRAAERDELARWFGGAQDLLASLVDAEPGASPVRCWPHHFDLATLISVTRDDSGAATQTIGVGLSPGDETHAEPYLYVSPWPYPEPAALPALQGGGDWHTEGYAAAILLGSRIAAAGAADAQRVCIDGFLEAAIAASRSALAA